MAILKQAVDTNAAKVPKVNLKRRMRLGERFIESWIFLSGLLSIVILLGIIAILLKEGLPAFTYTQPWEFLFGTK